MKKNIFLCFFLSLCAMQLFAIEKEIEMPLKQVTVYRRGAIVERMTNLKLDKGVTSFNVVGLSPMLDPKSVQVYIGNKDVTLVSVTSDLNFQNQKKILSQIKTLSEEIEQIEDSIDRVSVMIQILEEEKNLMEKNKEMKGNDGISAEDLSDMATFFRKNMSDIENTKSIYRKKQKQFSNKYAELMQKRIALNEQSSDYTALLNIVLSSNSVTSSNVEISYYVDDAEWNPIYDVRVTNSTQPLSLSYKAQVKQNSRETWKDAKLRISTVDPTISNVAPVLITNYLNFNLNYNKEEAKKKKEKVKTKTVKGIIFDEKGPLAFACVKVNGENSFSISDKDGNYEINVPENSSIEYSYYGYQNKVLSVNPESEKVVNVCLSKDENTSSNVSTQAIEQALCGRVSGVTSTRIRETSSLPESKDPLYIIDGESVDSKTLSSIDPADIVSMEAMTENASAIYGSRAANGVFLITTKNGVGTNVNGEIIPGVLGLQEFTIDVKNRYTIASGNEPVDIQMLEHKIPVDYRYLSIPKVDEKTYMSVRLPNWMQYNLLDGPVHIFLSNEYKGDTYLQTNSLLDTLSLSIGADKDISVKREKVKSFSSRNFLSSSKKEDREWKITIKNNKNTTVSVLLKDQYPVSAQDIIKVELLESSGALVDSQTGSLSWNVSLAPGEEKSFIVSYQVKYSSKKTLFVE